MSDERTVLLDLKEIVRRTRMSRMTIYRWMANQKFPKPIKLTERTIRWREAEIEAWITSRETSDAA